jgi:gluconolactonase
MLTHTSPTKLIRSDAVLQRLVSGFGFTEGPVWNSERQSLLFVDIPGDTIYELADGAARTFRQPSNMANGLTYDLGGRLLACEHATSRLTATEHDGTVSVLASHFEGRELNSPNDVIVSPSGVVYFSDPPYGRRPYFGVPRPQELDFQGLYAVFPDHPDPVLLDRDFDAPNGLCLSPDGAVLYVNDSERMYIKAYALGPDGTVGGGDVWFTERGDARPGNPDGMKVDAEGNVYCAGPGGIWVISPRAELLGVIEVPEAVGNFGWGGPTWNDLYIAATSSLYRLTTIVPGNPPAHSGAHTPRAR